MSDPACFVGIDVAKATLDCAVVPTGQTWQLSNADVAFPDLVARPRTFAPERSVFEATGGFEHGVVAALAAAGLPVVVANPRRVRDFGRACGQLAKSDRIDAAGARSAGRTSGRRRTPGPGHGSSPLARHAEAVVCDSEG